MFPYSESRKPTTSSIISLLNIYIKWLLTFCNFHQGYSDSYPLCHGFGKVKLNLPLQSIKLDAVIWSGFYHDKLEYRKIRFGSVWKQKYLVRCFILTIVECFSPEHDNKVVSIRWYNLRNHATLTLRASYWATRINFRKGLELNIIAWSWWLILYESYMIIGRDS